MRDGGPVIRFVAGAIGAPGERTFLLQFHTDTGLDTYLLEKGQVATLAEQAVALLSRVGLLGVGGDVEVPNVETPSPIEFRVGDIELGYAEATGVMTIVLGSIDEADEPARYSITPALLDAAARRGLEVVSAGRPECPRCGLAMDGDGHPCPHDNGDLREHRP